MAQRLYDNYVSHYGCAPTKTKYLIVFAKKYDIKIKFSKAKQIIRTNLNSLSKTKISKLVEKPRTRTNNDKVQSLFYVGEKIEYNTDPDDDDEEALHIHIGYIVEIQNKLNQISIKSKENNQIHTYFIDEIVVINQINDKNCSTKCQTALQRSENVSQQILNQTQDVELLHLQLHNLSVSKHIDFSKAPDMKIIAANVESNLKDLASSRIELKKRGQLLLKIFKFEPKNIGNIGAKKLWNKIKICGKDLINEIKLMDKMQNDYLNKLIELQSIIAKCNRKRDMKKLAIAMEKLNLSKHTFDEQLSKLSEKALCSLDEAIKNVLGTEAAKELTNNVTRDQNRYLQCKNKLDVLQRSITYINKEIEDSKQLHEYFHQDLSEIKTALRRIQCQIQNITITPVRYQFYSKCNECVKCVKCNDIVYAFEYDDIVEYDDLVYALENGKVIHNSCFNCCECGELISENDDNCVYIAEDGVKMYCGEACVYVKVTLKRQLNKIKQDIKRNKQDNVRLNGEINRLNQDITSQKQMLEQATYKLQKSMRKLDNVVKQTGVKAEDLVYFVSNVSAILPSILNSRDKLNCLSSNMHATKKMIDRSFRDGGKIRVDDYISNSQEFKHSLTKVIEPMNDNGIIYMSQLQCDDEKYSPLKITMNDSKLSEQTGTDNDNKMIIKQMEWNQLEHHERRALRRISCRDWRTEDKMGRKYTAKQAKIFSDYLQQLNLSSVRDNCTM